MSLAHAIVFNPIILSSILQSLDPGDILSCRRVCVFFNSIINSSKDVRRALYLLPASTPTVLTPFGQGVLYRINPLLKAKFKPFFLINMNSNYGLWNEIALNHLLPNDGRTAVKSEWDNCLATIRALFRREASWRDMLVTQPPITELKLIWLDNLVPRQPLHHTRLQFEHGLTMGVLYDLMFCCVGIKDGGSFGVDWKASSPQRHATNTHTMYGRVANSYVSNEATRPWSVGDEVILRRPSLVLITRSTNTTYSTNEASINHTQWKTAFMPQEHSRSIMGLTRSEAINFPRDPHHGWIEEWRGLVYGANRTAGTPEEYLRDRQVFFGSSDTSFEERFNNPAGPIRDMPDLNQRRRSFRNNLTARRHR